ncbi:MAG: hypothetical protein LLG01_09925 [Planctomycetaceae bacterium]|nr:hypothetical protein [Planctomycetaceae bacterium]
MWDDLRRQVEYRLKRLDNNVVKLQPVLKKAKLGNAPDDIELSALAFMLQSSYSDIEEVFKTIAKAMNDIIHDQESWHRNLLESMQHPTPARPPVISPALHQALRDYLNFRHYARYSSVVDLNWQKMAPLVHSWEETLSLFKVELLEFMVKLRK